MGDVYYFTVNNTTADGMYVSKSMSGEVYTSNNIGKSLVVLNFTNVSAKHLVKKIIMVEVFSWPELPNFFLKDAYLLSAVIES